MNSIKQVLNGTNEIIKFLRGTYILSVSSLFEQYSLSGLVFFYSANVNSKSFGPFLKFFCFCFENHNNPCVYKQPYFFNNPGVEMLQLSLTSHLLCSVTLRYDVKFCFIYFFGYSTPIFFLPFMPVTNIRDPFCLILMINWFFLPSVHNTNGLY